MAKYLAESPSDESFFRRFGPIDVDAPDILDGHTMQLEPVQPHPSGDRPSTYRDERLAQATHMNGSHSVHKSSAMVPSHSDNNGSPASSDLGSDPEFEKLLWSFGQHPDQIAKLKAQRKVDCAVCGVTEDHGSTATTIQCTKCLLCSHWSCIKTQFGPGRRTLQLEDSWMCPGRCNQGVPVWDNDL